jgi:hypothetical protein
MALVGSRMMALGCEASKSPWQQELSDFAGACGRAVGKEQAQDASPETYPCGEGVEDGLVGKRAGG